MTTRRKPTSQTTRRVRGFSATSREDDINARMPAIALFTSDDPQAIRSALRAMRRALHVRGGGYDPVRHAALLRLHKKKAPPSQAAPRPVRSALKI